MGKPFELTPRLEALLKKNTIDLSGKVDYDMGYYVREALLRLLIAGSPEITVRIMSSGGETPVGLDIYNALAQYPGFKTGIVDGFCNSAVALILQACDLRVAAPSGTIVIHNARMCMSGSGIDWELIDPDTRMHMPKKEVDSFLEHLEKARELQRLSDQVISHRCGMDIASIRTLCRKDESISASKALALNIIDKILLAPQPRQKKKSEKTESETP